MTEVEFLRFCSKIELPFDGEELDKTKCWIWKGSKQLGYGKFSIGIVTYMAHRLMYEHLLGEITEGYHIHHICNTKDCVNIHHLAMVTPKQNSTESGKLRRKSCCKNGHPLNDNTMYIYYNKTGRPERRCKKCRLAKMASKHRRKQLEALVDKLVSSPNNLEILKLLRSK